MPPLTPSGAHPSGAPRAMTSIILAAGSGTRMRSPDRHKVCLSLGGRPVIARALDAYSRCGVGTHFIVVGKMAEQVMQAVEGAPGVHAFCFQAEQRGTGHAARVAAEALEAMGYEEDVLVVAGDKVLEDTALHRLIAAFHREGADLAFLTGDAGDFPTAGRVVPGADGGPAGIVEVFDIARATTLAAMHRAAEERPIPAEDAERMALAAFGRAGKAATALGGLWDAIRSGEPVSAGTIAAYFPGEDGAARLNGASVSEPDLERAREANLSVYLFRAPALYEALARIGTDNAQHEEYLTDSVSALASLGRRVITVPVERPTEAMAFNTPEEFARIEEHVAPPASTARDKARVIRSVSEWLDTLGGPGAAAALGSLYGAGGADLAAKSALLRSALDRYGWRFGDGPVLIARAPGRLNVMGRHVDHQGGAGNLIAISPDTFAVMGAREDSSVRLHSTDPEAFPDRSFAIEDAMAGYAGEDWLAFVNGAAVRARGAAHPGDWALYVEAVVARFQAHAGRRLGGFNAVVAGDIPIAAGLSSSSALVVATASGICEQNGIRLAPEEFVALCGEAEWYAGTRGGAGDHAAMVFGRRGHVAQFGSHPFHLLDTTPFPDDHVFLVCDSHVKAQKTAGARDIFNHRVACYHIGRELIRARHPDLAPRIAHLRDVSEEGLGCTLPELIGLIAALPETMTRDEVRRALPEEIALPLLATHSESAGLYPIRPVVVFGLAECARSRACADLLRAGDMTTFGRWMIISHDGDRVSRRDARGNTSPYSASCDDGAMAAWRERAERGEDGSALALQPGAYGCSTPTIDRMVEAALSVRGVLGAQISGAGLGGCMMALVRRDAVTTLEHSMAERFYAPEGLEPRMFACAPVAGSGLLRW